MRPSSPYARVVLDTNVLVSGLLNASAPPGRLVDAWLAERFALVTSNAQVDELRRVLLYPRLRTRIRAARARDVLTHMAALSAVGDGLVDLRLSPDPDDDVILATAVAGEADLVVSGDRAGMVSLRHVRGIAIVTPHEAIALLDLDAT